MGTITVDGIMNLGPCDGYTRERMEELRKTQCGRRKNITMKDILTSAVPPEDRLWLVLRNEFLTDKELQEIAIWCWEKIARPIWEKHYPDDKRPHKAVRIKKLWMKGTATDDELSAARYAALDAAGYAAGYAARDAALAAARYAALDTALDAAGYAAWDAARDAARAAAWDAALDAAGAKICRHILKKYN